MHRREFLVRMGGVLVAVPFVLEAVGCGDDTPSNPGNTDRFNSTSTADGTGHTHAVTVVCADLTLSTKDYTATIGAGHEHTVRLSMTQLQGIAAGTTVTVTSLPDGTGHTHTWAIRKPANAC